MKKYINIVPALGLIVVIMAMPLFYTAIFMGSFFLDTTPHINPGAGHVDHNANKVWEGMSKKEYQKIKYVEEHKYKYENEEPAFNPDESSSFNLFEVETEKEEY
ncbi:hypothetical protein [Peribacillus frigoritolerans]|uniref:hypothetical protein n=1 Tax=Peribacillus frigoritolerans TaxID=450367 RepID=UPI0024C11E31|nr:hypothetical protein [Peribacillus frigoritolerans]WHX62781.1 hypothetical protein QNH33_04105 [Peribacillus frigoritolerans]